MWDGNWSKRNHKLGIQTTKTNNNKLFHEMFDWDIQYPGDHHILNEFLSGVNKTILMQKKWLHKD